jgi:phospholipase/carboxylesterase
MTKELLDFVETNPPGAANASVILMHGLGADGHDFASIVPQLNLTGKLSVRFVFPHAPVRPITINAGYQMRAWYDILGFDKNQREDEKGIADSAMAIEALIEQEISRGIPTERIVLAGFSQGGAMALYCGLRYPRPLGGILALSTYLPIAKTLAAQANHANKSVPIFMAHGAQDPVLPLEWATITDETLKALGYKVDFHTYPMAHTVCADEVLDIKKWFEKIL